MSHLEILTYYFSLIGGMGERSIVAIVYNWCVFDRVRGTGTIQRVVEHEHRMIDGVYEGIECVRIEEHAARGDGDKWFYDIHYSDGSIHRVFNVNEVFYK